MMNSSKTEKQKYTDHTACFKEECECVFHGIITPWRFVIIYDAKKAGMHKAYRPKEFILLCMVDYLARPMSSSLKILSSITLTSLMIGLKSI